MNEWFEPTGAHPVAVLIRLLAALLSGGAVAWIHNRTSRSSELSVSFPATLVLLSVLIAMVTQVIGDNVARAFSLVGALSIVRFRTVVRDTRDTAFVIFAVVVGMASGAHNLWVGLFGLLVAGLAAFLLAARPAAVAAPAVPFWQPDYELRVRTALAVKLEESIGSSLAAYTGQSRLSSMSTVKQGTAMEGAWDLILPPGQSTEAFVRAVTRIEGVQDVRLTRFGRGEEN